MDNKPSTSTQSMDAKTTLNIESRKRKSQNELNLINQNENNNATTEIPTSDKRNRYAYNFWKKPHNETEKLVDNEKHEQFIKINELKIGKLFGKLLKFRVSYKNQLRETGPLSFHGIDETSAIAFVNFGEHCVKLDEKIKINNIYSLENFTVEMEKPSYPSGTGNPFQIKLNVKSVLTLSINESHFPEIPLNLKPIDNIESVKNNEKIDIIGILVEDYGVDFNDIGTKKRDLAITDKSKETIIATLWALEAENFKCDKFTIIIIKNGNVGEFQGNKKINCNLGTLVWCNPDIKQATDLQEWFNETLLTEQK